MRAKKGKILRFRLYQNIVNKNNQNYVLLYNIYVNFTGVGGAGVGVHVCYYNMYNCDNILLYICENRCYIISEGTQKRTF